MPVLKNSLGTQALILAEQEACIVTENIFKTHGNEDKHQYNGTVK